MTQDTLKAIDTLFEEPIREPWAEQMRRDTNVMMDVFVGIGVQADLSDVPLSCTFPTSEPIQIGELTFDQIGFNNYSGYEGYAPEGVYSADNRADGRQLRFLERSKRKTAPIRRKSRRWRTRSFGSWSASIRRLRGKVAVVDVATPLTYERYLHSYKGSWMMKTQKGDANRRYSGKPENISNLYFAGQRLITPGGCPVALITGRTAVAASLPGHGHNVSM